MTLFSPHEEIATKNKHNMSTPCPLSFAGQSSESCSLFLNGRLIVPIEPAGTGAKASQLIEAGKNTFCAQKTSPSARRGSDSMSRPHFAESIILFARELHSRPGNQTKKPRQRSAFLRRTARIVLHSSSECDQQSECYDSA